MQATLAVHRSELAASEKPASLSATLHCPGLSVVDVLTDSSILCDASIQINIFPASKVLHGVQVNFREVVGALVPSLIRDRPCRVVCTTGMATTDFPDEFYSESESSVKQNVLSSPAMAQIEVSTAVEVQPNELSTSLQEQLQLDPLPSSAQPQLLDPTSSSSKEELQHDMLSSSAQEPLHPDTFPSPAQMQLGVSSASMNPSMLPPTSSVQQEHQQQQEHELLPTAACMHASMYDTASNRASESSSVAPAEIPPHADGATPLESKAAVDDNLLMLAMQGKERMVSDFVNNNNNNSNNNSNINSNDNSNACALPFEVPAYGGDTQNCYPNAHQYSSISDFISQANGAFLSGLDMSIASVTSGNGSDTSSGSMYSTPSSAISMSAAYAPMQPWCHLCNQFGHIFDIELTHGVFYAKSNTTHLYGTFCDICGAISHKTEAHSRLDTKRMKVCTRAYNGTCAYDPCKFSHSHEEMVYLQNHPVVNSATPRCFKTVPFTGYGGPSGMKLILGCYQVGVAFEMCCKKQH